MKMEAIRSPDLNYVLFFVNLTLGFHQGHVIRGEVVKIALWLVWVKCESVRTDRLIGRGRLLMARCMGWIIADTWTLNGADNIQI